MAAAAPNRKHQVPAPPAARLGEPDEVAGLAVFLASDEVAGLAVFLASDEAAGLAVFLASDEVAGLAVFLASDEAACRTGPRMRRRAARAAPRAYHNRAFGR